MTHRNRYLLSGLASLAIILAVGCSKIKEQFQDKPANPAAEAPPPVPTAQEQERMATARQTARDRFAKALKDLKPFDRDARVAELLMRHYRIDLGQLFPDGYDATLIVPIEEVDRRVEQRLEAVADEAHPPARKAELEAQALALFPHYKIGQEVTVICRQTKLSGALKATDQTHATIGDQTVLINDIAKPEYWGFLPEKAVVAERQRHLRKHYEIPRSETIRQHRDAVKRQVYANHGYYTIDGRLVRIDALVGLAKAQADKEAQAYDDEQRTQLREAIATQMVEEGLLDPGVDIWAQIQQVGEVVSPTTDTPAAAPPVPPAPPAAD